MRSELTRAVAATRRAETARLICRRAWTRWPDATVVEWICIIEGSDPMYDNAKARGQRDSADMSFAMFGSNAFHSGQI